MPWRRADLRTATPATLRTVPSVAAMAVATGWPSRAARSRVRPPTRRLAGGWTAPGVQDERDPVNASTLVRSNASTSAEVRQGATTRPGGRGTSGMGAGGRSIHGSRAWRSNPNGPRSSAPPASRNATSPGRPATAPASRSAATPARSDRAPRNTGEDGAVRQATVPSSTQPIPRARSASRCQTDSPLAASATGSTLLGTEQVAEVDPGGRGPVGGDAGRPEAQGPGPLGDGRDHPQAAVLGQLQVADADTGALAVLHADQQAGQAGQVGVGGQGGQEHRRLDLPAAQVAGEVGGEAGPAGLGPLVHGGRAGLGVDRVGLDPGRGEAAGDAEQRVELLAALEADHVLGPGDLHLVVLEDLAVDPADQAGGVDHDQ